MIGCNSQSKNKTLRLCASHRISNFDPRLCGDSLSSSLQYYLHEGLFKMTTIPIESGLSKEYSVSADHKTYTFSLKKARWSNGSLITADDFINSWKQLVSPDFPSPNAELLFCVKNAKAIKYGKKGVETLGLKAINDKTIQIELEYPHPHIIDILSFSTLSPHKTHENQLLFSGPFMIDSMTTTSLILKKNPYYYNKNKIDLEKIEILFVDNPTTAFRLFKNKKIDVLAPPFSSIPPFLPLSDKSPFCHRTEEIPATTFLCFNQSNRHLNCINVRKALISPLQTNMSQVTRYPLFIKPTTFLPSFLSKAPLDQVVTNTSTLKNLPKTLTLRYPQAFPHHELALFIQEFWSRTYGIRIKLIKDNPISHLDALRKKDYDVALFYCYAHYPKAYSILERFSSISNLKNYISWEDQQFFLDLRNKKIDLALSRLQKSHLLFPLLHHKKALFYHKHIKNVHLTPSGALFLQGIKKN